MCDGFKMRWLGSESSRGDGYVGVGVGGKEGGGGGARGLERREGTRCNV